MKCVKLSCKPIEKIRIGLIGLGNRGIATLQRYMDIDGVSIVALSDLRDPNIAQSISILESHNKPRPATYCEANAWKDVCESSNVDLVYICTDWATHADMAVYAMKHGKHVALEVPAAMTTQECWQLVHTAEETQRHCIMLENCCYDTFHLGIMGMVKTGILGTINHCEGAYIHDLRYHEPEKQNAHGSKKNWMHIYTSQHQGNPYPTHGLGPVCQIMGINNYDRLHSLVSVTSLNGINNTLLTTKLGKTILLQFDEVTPRPYSRLQTLCGTAGFVQKYPQRTLQLDGCEPLYGDNAEDKVMGYCPYHFLELINEGKKLGVKNIMNYIMDRRLIDALRNGNSLDLNVYDAALWSCVTELSARSAMSNGTPMLIPDFLGL